MKIKIKDVKKLIREAFTNIAELKYDANGMNKTLVFQGKQYTLDKIVDNWYSDLDPGDDQYEQAIQKALKYLIKQLGISQVRSVEDFGDDEPHDVEELFWE